MAALHRLALPETLGAASLEALAGALAHAASEPNAGPWALEGAAPGRFCRGMDFEGMARDGADSYVSLRRFATCLARLRHAPRPTIALVSGEALGGGVGLAAACDVVLATADATFALPEALFGLLPGVVMPVLLERMTPQKARLLALRGQRCDAAWALAHGLVDAIVPAGGLAEAARRAGRELGRVARARVLGLRELARGDWPD